MSIDPFMVASPSWQATRRGAVRDRSAPIVPTRRPLGLMPDPRPLPEGWGEPRLRRAARRLVAGWRAFRASVGGSAVIDAALVGAALGVVWVVALGLGR